MSNTWVRSIGCIIVCLTITHMVSLEQYWVSSIGCFTSHRVNIRATCTRDTVPHNVGSSVGKCSLVPHPFAGGGMVWGHLRHFCGRLECN